MKRSLKITLISVASSLAVIGGVFGGFAAYTLNYKVTPEKEKIENNTGLIQAYGKALYDKDGYPIQLKGVNNGSALVQEDWMTAFQIGEKKDQEENYIKDKDNYIQYVHFAEKQFREAIKENTAFDDYSVDDIVEIYAKSFFNENDFKIVKNDLKMNAIRLPFYYLDILNEDLSVKDQKEAFDYFDWFLENCKQNDIYCILDLHGAPGSQNGYDHSGVTDELANLWDNEEYINATVRIWDTISSYYTNVKPELGAYIATYDILNEPREVAENSTTEKCWGIFDRIYDSIRENNDKHVITMEGCWDFSALPNPKDYEWENVQYEYHWYNWNDKAVPYDIYYMFNELSNIGRNYDVPVLIGEFTLFENKEAWHKQLNLFDQRNYSWTIWNYKICSDGWWTNSWGVYTIQQKFVTEWEQKRVNIATCSYEEFLKVCEMVKTNSEKSTTGTLYDVLKEYNNK